MSINLNEFLVKANLNGYAGDTGNVKVESDKSTTIIYQNDGWRMHDNYFGGEPFGGREVVFKDDNPHWIMVYYGKVTEGVDLKDVYSFLKEALATMSLEFPFRGKDLFEKNNFKYKNIHEGNVNQFKGVEKIYLNDKEVFSADYAGGLIGVIKE